MQKNTKIKQKKSTDSNKEFKQNSIVTKIKNIVINTKNN